MTFMPHIPDAEFQQRADRTRQAMQSARLDLLFAFSTESEPAYVRYYSDYWPSFETAAALIPPEKPAALLIGPESRTFAGARSKIANINPNEGFQESSQPDYPGQTAGLARHYHRRVPAAPDWHCRLAHVPAHHDGQSAGGVRRGGDRQCRRGRARGCHGQDGKRFNCLRRAAKISELGFKAILENIKAGMTEVQLAGIAAGAMLANGAESTGYPIWCCSAELDPGHQPSDASQSAGREIIHFSCRRQSRRLQRQHRLRWSLGQCPDDTRKFLQVGLDAMNMTIDLMRAGTPAAAVATKVHDRDPAAGTVSAILYGPAHGCGQMECEFPFLETSSTFHACGKHGVHGGHVSGGKTPGLPLGRRGDHLKTDRRRNCRITSDRSTF